MSLRLANDADVRAIMAIIGQAQEKLRTEGIDQWQDGYPNETVIRADIDADIAYVWDVRGKLETTEELGGVIAYIMLTSATDPDYDSIDGEWLNTDCSHAVAHRLAVSTQYQGEGYAGQVLRRVQELAVEAGHRSIRMDTHADNQAMQRTLEHAGFTYCGKVFVRGTEPRLAYERLLD